MSKWAKTTIRTHKQSGKFRVLHHFTVMQPSKPGKDNTHAISDTVIQEDIQSHIMITILPSPTFSMFRFKTSTNLSLLSSKFSGST